MKIDGSKFLVVVSLFALFICGFAAFANEDPQYGGTIDIAMDRDVGGIDPASANSEPRVNVAVMSFDSLLSFDSEGNVVPSLAEDWEISQDGLVYKFYLRKGVQLHSGREMTAEDVKYSCERLSNPKTKALGFAILDTVKGKEQYANGEADEIVGIKVIDKYTIEFHLDKPDIVFLRRMATAYTAVVGHEGIGADYEMVTPIGAGPFVVEEYVPNQFLTLKRFENYWDEGKPYLDGINVHMNVDASVQFMRYMAGQLDVLGIGNPVILASLENDPQTREEIVRFAGPSVQVLTLNSTTGIFTNKDLRHAVSLAIDRDRLANVILRGLAEPATAPLPKGVAENVGVPKYYGEYNPEKARELIAKAGYPDGFSVELVCVATSNLEASEAVQADLEKVGIHVEISPLEAAAYTARLNAGKEEFANVNAGGQMGDADWILYRFLHSSMTPGFNRAAFKNAEYDALVEKARHSTNDEDANEFYRQAVEIVVEEMPWVPLYFPTTVRAVKSHLHGVVHTPVRPNIIYKDAWLKK